jgi:hypothetical protein
MARRHGTRGATGAYSGLSFSQVVAKASNSTGGYSSADSPVIADEDLEMTRHDPAMRSFFNPADSDDDSSSDNGEEALLDKPSSGLTQMAAASLLDLFSAPATGAPLPTRPPPQNQFHAAAPPAPIDRATLLQRLENV